MNDFFNIMKQYLCSCLTSLNNFAAENLKM